jgi:hypothetical protein
MWVKWYHVIGAVRVATPLQAEIIFLRDVNIEVAETICVPSRSPATAFSVAELLLLGVASQQNK